MSRQRARKFYFLRPRRRDPVERLERVDRYRAHEGFLAHRDGPSEKIPEEEDVVAQVEEQAMHVRRLVSHPGGAAGAALEEDQRPVIAEKGPRSAEDEELRPLDVDLEELHPVDRDVVEA